MKFFTFFKQIPIRTKYLRSHLKSIKDTAIYEDENVLPSQVNNQGVEKMRRILTITALLLSVSCNECMATPSSEQQGQQLSKNLLGQTNQSDIVSIMRKVTDWQLANPGKWPFGDWVVGPFANGVVELGLIPGNESYIDKLMDIGRRENWAVIKTHWVANDHCTPQTYLKLFELKQDPAMIAPTVAALDKYIKAAEGQDDNLEFKPKNKFKWSWCDALYMSPPVFAQMAKITGDRKYLDYLHKWWWKASDFYYDKDERLFFRDQSFFSKKESNGKKVFWARGNGWVIGGLTRVLQYVPKDDPMRPRYEGQFKEICTRLAELQGDDGLWRAGLLDPAAFINPETSGSGFFIYALAYGVNQKLLERDKFKPIVDKAWNALCSHVEKDGRLGGVQPIGDSPVKFNAKSSLPYGVGALLLAGSEMYKLAASE